MAGPSGPPASVQACGVLDYELEMVCSSHTCAYLQSACLTSGLLLDTATKAVVLATYSRTRSDGLGLQPVLHHELMPSP